MRAVGVMSAGIFDKTAAWASLREEGTSDVHFLPFVPVREGLWFGYGRDAGRPVVLVGGGSDARGGAHSDVYAVDLDAGGDTVLVAADDGDAGGATGPGIGPHAWVTGSRATSAGGWALRVVPARTTADGSVRYAAYERHTGSRRDLGWAAAGGSAHDTPRSDATLAHALEEGTSCERDGAPWYAAPGTWRYDDDPTHPVLQCAQAVPPSPIVSLLPRQVSAYALGERALWTVSHVGLERWSLEGGAPQRLQQLPLSLPGKPNARRTLAASDQLVATSRGARVAVFAPSAEGDGTFGALGTLELEDEVVALFAGAKDLWAVGGRRVTHLRVRDGAVTILGIFELVRYEGDLFARRAAQGHDDEDDDHEHGDGHGEHHGDDDLGIVSASLRGPILAVALEHEIVTLDLREPERLPTFGSRHFDEKVREVATDGRFVYLRTSADEPDGPGHTFRATTRSALEPAGNDPARSFAKNRSYAGRHAARLTGVALHVAVGSAP
ncbi:MAG: hypothetical protein HY908_23755 [Myxococcales bacterium]|nr:hypothetical protein [Myxococcales bacterium]